MDRGRGSGPQGSPIVEDPGGGTKTLAVSRIVERKVWNSNDDDLG